MRESNGRVFDLQKGDLVVTDRANGLRKRIVFVLSRVSGHCRSYQPIQISDGR
jgi:hypothetical protein